VLDVYRAVDDGIGRVLAAVDDGDTVIVTSGDGMGPNFSGCHLVPEALHRLDLYHAADVGRSRPGGERPKQSALSALRGLVPPELRRAVSRCLPPMVQHRLSMKWANADIDWERTRAFCIPNANEAFVRINLAGREPRGNVAEGEAYRELVELLKLRLGELVNPATGVVGPEHVIHVEDVFQGPRRGDLPDVIVTWNPAARVLAELESEACGRVSLRAGHETAPYYTGNHRPTAFALARGPGVRAGSLLAGAHVLDLAPTVAALLGREPAAHLEGRVLDELLGSGGRGA